MKVSLLEQAFIGTTAFFLAQPSELAGEPLFDLRSQFVGTQPRDIYIFPPDQALYCNVKFTPTSGGGFTSVSEASSRDTNRRQNFFSPDGARIANSHTLLSLCDDSTNAPSGARASPDSKQLIIESGGSSNGQLPPGNTIVVSGPADAEGFGVTMIERSTSNHTKYFGRQAYPINTSPETGDAGLKIDQYITLKGRDPAYGASWTGFPIADYSSLDLILTVTPKKENVKTVCLNPDEFAGIDPLKKACAARCPTVCTDLVDGACSIEGSNKVCANNTSHSVERSASKFRLSLGNVAWRAPECQNDIDRKNKEYCKSVDTYKYDGRFMYYLLPLFTQFADKSLPEPYPEADSIATDSSTDGAALYRADIRAFNISVENSSTNTQCANCNPFQNPELLNYKITLTGDLRNKLKDAINAVYADQSKKCPSRRDANCPKIKLLPPRICHAITQPNVLVFCNNPNADPATSEDADAYAGHFYLKSVDTGYEVSGLSELTYKINDLSINGTKTVVSRANARNR